MKKSKYEPLHLFLNSLPRDEVLCTLSFRQVEQILSASLPDSAIDHREWWSNQVNTANRPQAQSWMSAGFEVEAVHQTHPDAWVRFRRK